MMFVESRYTVSVCVSVCVTAGPVRALGAVVHISPAVSAVASPASSARTRRRPCNRWARSPSVQRPRISTARPV